MNQNLMVVLGMTVIYLFSLAGMVFAYVYYKKNKKD
jgi:hypothetical protein